MVGVRHKGIHGNNGGRGIYPHSCCHITYMEDKEHVIKEGAAQKNSGN